MLELGKSCPTGARKKTTPVRAGYSVLLNGVMSIPGLCGRIVMEPKYFAGNPFKGYQRLCHSHHKRYDLPTGSEAALLIGHNIPVESSRRNGRNRGKVIGPIAAALRRASGQYQSLEHKKLGRTVGLSGLGNHVRWHEGPDGKPNPEKCELCREMEK